MNPIFIVAGILVAAFFLLPAAADEVVDVIPNEKTYLPMAQLAAAKWNIEAAMLCAIVRHESHWNSNATNLTGGDAARGGAYGLGQMTLKTARALNPLVSESDLLDPATNLDYCARLIASIMDEVGTDDSDVAAAYNSGKDFAHAPLTTRISYVPLVLGNLSMYRSRGV